MCLYSVNRSYRASQNSQAQGTAVLVGSDSSVGMWTRGPLHPVAKIMIKQLTLSWENIFDGKSTFP